MKPTKARIVFLGTPEFAVKVLLAVINSGHEVIAVVTTPDKPTGRGQKQMPSAVKVTAIDFNIPVLQPEKLKDPGFIRVLDSLGADIFVVVAFRMLPIEVWSLPKKGCFNVHASLLPNYRGAAPIQWAIWNGETITGNTTFLLNNQIDAGAILLQDGCAIEQDDNFGSLYEKLSINGAELAVRTIDGLMDDSLYPVLQNVNNNTKSAPKIFPEMTYLNPHKKAIEIQNQIRALSPKPGAKLSIISPTGEELELKIFKSKLAYDITGDPGSLILDKSRLYLAAEDHSIELIQLQLPAKKAMDSKALINGYPRITAFQYFKK